MGEEKMVKALDDVIDLLRAQGVEICRLVDAHGAEIARLTAAIEERDAEIERLRKTMTIVVDLDIAHQAFADLLAELKKREG